MFASDFFRVSAAVQHWIPAWKASTQGNFDGGLLVLRSKRSVVMIGIVLVLISLEVSQVCNRSGAGGAAVAGAGAGVGVGPGWGSGLGFGLGFGIGGWS